MPRKVPLNEFGLPTQEYFQHLKKSTRLKYIRQAQKEANKKATALQEFLSVNPEYQSRILKNYKEKYNIQLDKDFKFRTPHSFIENKNPKKGVAGEMSKRYSDIINFLRAKTSTSEGIISEEQSKVENVNSTIEKIAADINYITDGKISLDDDYKNWSKEEQRDFWRAFEIYKDRFSQFYGNKTSPDAFLQGAYAIFKTTPNLIVKHNKGDKLEYSPSKEFKEKMDSLNEDPYSYRKLYNDIIDELKGEQKNDR